MEEKKLQAELAANCKQHGKQLSELLEAYELACLGYDMQEQRCDDIYNQILAENEFYAASDSSRMGVGLGDRITDKSQVFLLSEEERKRLQSLVQPALTKAGITDERGYYVERWSEIRCHARSELVDYILDDILPLPLRMSLEVCRNSFVWQDKLIKVFKSSFKDNTDK